MSGSRPTVLHVSPHPDDESVGPSCTLLALHGAGWRVVNLTCSLGRPSDHGRRRTELAAALKIAGFENVLPPESVPLSGDDNVATGMHQVIDLVAEQVERTGARLVVGPHPRDSHHGHATVARAVRQVVRRSRGSLVWWMWSIWAPLPRPTVVVDCSDELLAVSEEMLRRYEGENERSGYLDAQRAVRRANAVFGVEKTFGFGSVRNTHAAADVKHAELLTEVTTTTKRQWLVGAPRVLDPSAPLVPAFRPLDDLSLLSTTRLRPTYQPALMDASERWQRLFGKSIKYGSNWRHPGR